MNWFTKLFRPKPLSQSDRDFFDACNAFTAGEKIWRESTLIKGTGWQESKLNKTKEALKYFDEAIKKGLVEPSVFHHGFNESEVFSLRGSCLNELGFYFEALEDYNKAIEKRPQKGVASNYYMRSLIKDSLFDFDGSLADLKETIRLSKLDNDDNTYWNNYAKTTGFASQTAVYEMWLPTEAEISSKRKRPPEMIEEELKKIKRRENKAPNTGAIANA
jgi:tetratricopeptide (TPR) repeat protein